MLSCAVAGNASNLSLAQWQALGQDHGTTIAATPSIDVILNQARVALGMQPTRPGRAVAATTNTPTLGE